MADYILLDQSEENNRIRVVVHSTVPTGTNQAGVTWKDALVAHLDSTVSQVPVSFLPAGRQNALDAGDIYEWSFTHDDDANLAPATRLANLESAVSAKESDELDRMANRLRYLGLTGSI